MSAEKEGFATRWSRMKREGEISEPEPEAPEALAEPEAEGPPDDTLSDEELLEKYDLPDPDAMQAGDDFSLFMKKAVPEKLRRRALRRLWLSNPVLANLDEMVDYGEDFTDAATVVENMSTIYQVGKGSAWKFKAEQERLAALAAEESDEELPEQESEEPEMFEAVSEAEPVVEEATDNPEPVDEPPEEEIEVVMHRPRPMRFSFE